MRKKYGIRLTAAAVAVAAAPFLVTQAFENPPDMNRLMAAAVNFTADSGFATETVDFGNGSLILYKPKSSEAAVSTASGGEAPESSGTYEQSEAQDTLNEESSLTPITEPAQEKPEDGKDPETTGQYIITQNINQDSEDLTVFDSNDLEVFKNTFGSVNGTNYIWLEKGGQVRNCTELDNDFVREQTKINTDISLKAFSDQPQVLIMHTHACESYLVGSGDYQDESYTCRTTDPNQSVVAVGQKISEKLAEKGICVIHDGTMHDYPAYNGCYDRAEDTVSSILKKYPTIKVVLDVHRDGIVESDGTPVAAVNEINGRQAAQVMIISAASDGYYYVPNYLDNFHFACLLQGQMESENPGITRPVLFQYCQYNQHLTTGSLLLEIGSQGNTLEQALYTAELIGDSIGNALLTLCS